MCATVLELLFFIPILFFHFPLFTVLSSSPGANYERAVDVSKAREADGQVEEARGVRLERQERQEREELQERRKVR